MEQGTKPVYTLAEAREFIEANRERVDGTYRNQYHLMPPVGWMNDPNGFIYYQGEYHLFYQFYPYDSKWGPMHWGHAKTKDLIHWEELPTALAPDEPYDQDGCFSGSAIEKDGKLYLMYTGHRIENGVVYQTQCIAVSEDGINFEKYAANPVIDEKRMGEYGNIHDFRDPKVIKKDDSYYSIIASKTEDDRGLILLYQSDDLYEWKFFSVLLEGTHDQGVMWECPDLFHLNGKDVLIMSPIEINPRGVEFHNTSSTVAFIGQMDWETGSFAVENDHEIDFGLDFYAPQTTRDSAGRQVMIAWMQMWGRTLPTDLLGHKWAGSMTLARELWVENNRLYQKPISDVYQSLKIIEKQTNLVIENEVRKYQSISANNRYYQLTLGVSQADAFQVYLAKNKLGGLVLDFDKETNQLTLSRKDFGHPITGSEPSQLTERTVILNGNKIELEIFMDTSSVEIFVNQEKTMTFTFYEETLEPNLYIEAKGSLEVPLLEIGCVQV
ncbi:glycoside hydrolase family 32 protein [Jeotgalibaca arthritidis]|uniref:glycoside hydrolase family 32 protein n=1 Tax=Jeotgalibaca arthritidis TaxID=1868794 RepID=UPI00359F6FC4